MLSLKQTSSSTGTVLRAVIVALCVALMAASPDRGSDPYAAKMDVVGGHWRIFTVRVVKVFGVGVGVALATALLALLPIGIATAIYGCFVNYS